MQEIDEVEIDELSGDILLNNLSLPFALPRIISTGPLGHASDGSKVGA